MLGKDQGANAVEMGNRGYGNAPMDGRNDVKKDSGCGACKARGGHAFCLSGASRAVFGCGNLFFDK